jgi:hypothetical protein
LEHHGLEALENSPESTTLTRSIRSDPSFPAKEATQVSNSLSYYEQLPPTTPECSVNPNLGGSETILDSSVSHLSPNMLKQSPVTESPTSESWFDLKGFATSIRLRQIFINEAYQDILKKESSSLEAFGQQNAGPITFSLQDRLRKGWNKECGNLRLRRSRSRMGKLLDRDYVWVVTQTMVSFENWALWVVHTVLTYKVYPGFWGRNILRSNSVRKLPSFGTSVSGYG